MKTYSFPDDIADLLNELARDGMIHYLNQAGTESNETPVGRRILRASPAKRRLLVMAMICWLENDGRLNNDDHLEEDLLTKTNRILVRRKRHNELHDLSDGHIQYGLILILNRQENGFFASVRRKIPFEHNDLVKLLQWCNHYSPGNDFHAELIANVLTHYLHRNPLSSALQNQLETLVVLLRLIRGHNVRIAERLMSIGKLERSTLPFSKGEAWSEAVAENIETMDSGKRSMWLELFKVCALANSSKPTKKWKNSACSALEKIGFDEFKIHLSQWLPLVSEPRPKVIPISHPWVPDVAYLIDRDNQTILRGLVWLYASQPDDEIARILTDLALSTYRSIRVHGVRSPKVGNACVWALGQMGGPDNIKRLATIQKQIKSKAAHKEVEKALLSATERKGPMG